MTTSASDARTTLTNEIARDIPVLPKTEAEQAFPAIGPLSADDLRARFKRELAWQPEMLGDGQSSEWQQPDTLYRHAAVLIPLVVREAHEGGLQVLLTQRTAHLKSHAGQISFAGGRAEPSDPSLIDTALREAAEEIGLAREHIEVLGTLPEYRTISNFIVTPVVALVHPPFTLTLQESEVAEAFEVPLTHLTNPQNHERRAREFFGKLRYFYAMPYQEPVTGSERFIWGATAAMLRNLYHFLRAE